MSRWGWILVLVLGGCAKSSDVDALAERLDFLEVAAAEASLAFLEPEFELTEFQIENKAEEYAHKILLSGVITSSDQRLLGADADDLKQSWGTIEALFFSNDGKLIATCTAHEFENLSKVEFSEEAYCGFEDEFKNHKGKIDLSLMPYQIRLYASINAFTLIASSPS